MTPEQSKLAAFKLWWYGEYRPLELKHLEMLNDGLIEHIACWPDRIDLDLVTCQAVLETTVIYFRDPQWYVEMMERQTQHRAEMAALRESMAAQSQPFRWWPDPVN